MDDFLSSSRLEDSSLEVPALSRWEKHLKRKQENETTTLFWKLQTMKSLPYLNSIFDYLFYLLNDRESTLQSLILISYHNNWTFKKKQRGSIKPVRKMQ